MKVFMFKDRFAPKVRDGSKRQTIRPRRRNPLKPGDAISLRRWTGKPYRSKQEELGTGIVEAVEAVEIRLGSPLPIVVKPPSPEFDYFPCPDKFARADGFEDWNDMRQWFLETHGLPFHGSLIRWRKGGSCE